MFANVFLIKSCTGMKFDLFDYHIHIYIMYSISTIILNYDFHTNRTKRYNFFTTSLYSPPQQFWTRTHD